MRVGNWGINIVPASPSSKAYRGTRMICKIALLLAEAFVLAASWRLPIGGYSNPRMGSLEGIWGSDCEFLRDPSARRSLWIVHCGLSRSQWKIHNSILAHLRGQEDGTAPAAYESGGHVTAAEK